MTVDLRLGNVLDVLRTMDAESVHCIVTSPPYWGLRAYGTEPQVWRNGSEPCVEHEWGEAQPITTGRNDAGRNFTGGGGNILGSGNPGNQSANVNTCTRCGAWRGELGLEPTPELYVDHIVQIMREARRVLRGDGTLWLNIGDSYASGSSCARRNVMGNGSPTPDTDRPNRLVSGLKKKDLVGIPWRVAFALQADGWYLRSDIIWHKPNPMPESVRDRPTKAHEYIFLLSKSPRYFYDADAVREPHIIGNGGRQRAALSGDCRYKNADHKHTHVGNGNSGINMSAYHPAGRNRRSVWTVTTHPYSGAHFATFPPKLIEPCILAATSERGVCSKCGAPWVRVVEHRYAGRLDAPKREQAKESIDPAQRQWKHCHATKETDTLGWRASCACDAGEPVPATVLDPFNGAGTTGLVALQHGRNYIGIDLKPEYLEMTRKRLDGVQMMTA